MAWDLARFTAAQERCWPQALAEIQAGRKGSHWIWFIFPQLTGLGRSMESWYYGISGLEEARAYWEHPVLGPRLREISGVLLQLQESDPLRILGRPDDLKLCSSMTLFAHAVPEEPVFRQVLEKLYAGREDRLTLKLLDLTPEDE